jgi:hypothetical protein
VVEGALVLDSAHGPSAPTVSFAATSPARCRYGGGTEAARFSLLWLPFAPQGPPLVPERAPDGPAGTPLVTGRWRSGAAE